MKELLNKVVERIYRDEDSFENDAIVFDFRDGSKYLLMHEQDCCECVYVNDIAGDLDDFTGEKLLLADESSNCGEAEDGTQTWTYYKLSCNKGFATIRFHGSSNGYYSESVSLIKIK